MSIPGPLTRWVWHSTIRDWRHHTLVIALAAISVAAISFVALFIDQISVASHLRYGTATHAISVSDSDDQPLADVVADAEATFDDPQIVYQTPTVRFPGGSAEPFALDQMPGTSFGGAAPTVIDGHLPNQSGEIAITPRIRELFARLDYPTDIGATIPWDDTDVKLVGVFSDPNNTRSELLLVAPESIDSPVDATIIVETTTTEFESFAMRNPALGWEDFAVTARNDTLSIVAVYAFATVAMIVIGLLCSAGFYVMYRRRARNYAVLSSLGATARQMRRSMITSGAIIGTIAATIGVSVGLAGFVAARNVIAGIVDHNIALSEISPVAVLPAAILCVATTTLASLAPARSITRDSIRATLQNTSTKPLWRITASAALLAGIGVVAFDIGTLNTYPIAAVALILAALAFTPAIASRLDHLTSPLSVLWRLAGAELARHRSKTVVSIGALTIVATITTTIALVGAARDTHTANQPPNLPDTMVLVEPAFTNPTTYDANDIPSDVDDIAGIVEGATITPVLAPIDPERDNTLVQVAQQVDGVIVEGDIVINEYQPWIATPELAALFDLDLPTGDAPLLALQTSPVELGGWNITSNADRIDPAPLAVDEYGSIANTWITPVGVETNNYNQRTIAWIINTPTAPTDDQANAMFAAAGSTFNIEPRIAEPQPAPTAALALILGATVSTLMAAALVALIASESKRDLITLTAIGATSSATRSLTARHAMIMLSVAALLALPLSYVLLRAVVAGSGSFPAIIDRRVVVAHLVVVPLAGTAISYLIGSTRTTSHRRLLD